MMDISQNVRDMSNSDNPIKDIPTKYNQIQQIWGQYGDYLSKPLKWGKEL